MLTLIAAVAKNNCIGVNGALPWYLPEDFAHFKRHTMGKVVLMGRKTWESLPEKFRPLPNRTNVVITKQKWCRAPLEKVPGTIFSGAEVYGSLDEALAAHVNEDVFVIGGASLYSQTIDRADRLIITHVDRVVEGDSFFPELDWRAWQETLREDHDGFSFVEYHRIRIAQMTTQIRADTHLRSSA